MDLYVVSLKNGQPVYYLKVVNRYAVEWKPVAARIWLEYSCPVPLTNFHTLYDLIKLTQLAQLLYNIPKVTV